MSDESIKEYLSNIGRKGGLSKSEKKLEALKKAREAKAKKKEVKSGTTNLTPNR